MKTFPNIPAPARLGWMLFLVLLAGVHGGVRCFALAPINDAFAARLAVSGSTVTIAGTNTGATAQVSEPHYPAPSVWWTWVAPFDGLLKLTNVNAPVDIYTGESIDQLRQEATNWSDESEFLFTSQLHCKVVQGRAYQIRVGGSAGAVHLDLTVNPQTRLDGLTPGKPRFVKAGSIAAIAFQDDGKIIIGGTFDSVNGSPRHNIARLNSDGTLDGSWVPNVAAVTAMAIDAGYLYVGLEKISLQGNGGPISGWLQPTDSFSPHHIRAVAAHDGQVEIAGYYLDYGILQTVNATTGAVTAEFTPTPAGHFIDATISTASDDVFMAFHSSYAPNGSRFIRILGHKRAYGDDPFGAGDYYPENRFAGTAVYALATSPGPTHSVEWLYAGGEFTKVGGSLLSNLGRVSTDFGVADTSWVPNPNGRVTGLARQGSNLYVGGDFTVIGGQPMPNLAKLSTTGAGNADPAWRPAVIPQGAMATTANALFVSGFFDPTGGSDPHAFGLSKLDLIVGVRDPSFFATVEITAPATPMALVRQPDGKLIVGGDFDFVEGLFRRNLVRLDEDGSVDPIWHPDPNGRVTTLAVGRSAIFVAGGFTEIGGQNSAGLAKVDILGSDKADPLWNPAPKDGSGRAVGSNISSMTATNEDLYVGGFFSAIGGQNRSFLAKLNASGVGLADAGWNPGPDGNVNTLALNRSGTSLYVGGSFSKIGGQTHKQMAKLSTAGTGPVDAAWNPNPDSFTVSNLAVDSILNADGTLADGPYVYVLGSFSTIGGVARNQLARLSSGGTGAVDLLWNPMANNSAIEVNNSNPALAISESGATLFVTGINRVNGVPWTGLARVSTQPGAIIDPTWEPAPTPLTWPLLDIAVKGEGVYVVGGFSQVSGTEHAGFAYLPSLHAPHVVQAGSKLIVVPADNEAVETIGFRITGLNQVSLAVNGAARGVGSFVSKAEAGLGLDFQRAPGAVNPTITVVGAFGEEPTLVSAAGTTLAIQTLEPARYQFTQDNYTVTIGSPFPTTLPLLIPVQKVGSSAGTVTYSIIAATASGSGDFQDLTNGSLTFSAANTSRPISLQIRSDDIYRGDRVFYIRLSGVPPGAVKGTCKWTKVKILDASSNEGSLLRTEPVPYRPPPTAAGTFSFTLAPEFAQGRQWRLEGSALWLGSGATVFGLANNGSYTAEFRPIEAFAQPEKFTIALSEGLSQTKSITYQPLSAAEKVPLEIVIQPELVRTNANLNARGQWRFEGETGWRDGSDGEGSDVVYVHPGTYQVEFKALAGSAYVQPGTTAVVAGGDKAANAGQLARLTFYYTAAPLPFAPGTEPKLVPFAKASTQKPYLYTGQISTPLGFGSGCVVTEKTVLTAAHVVFDDATFSWVPDSQVRWMFQRYRGSYEPQPLTPRGRFIFDGYQGQRVTDNSYGVSTPESQGLDVSVLWFLEPAGRGMFSGYLVTEAGFTWLADSFRNKVLTGYPLGPDQNGWEKLWESPTVLTGFTKAYPASSDRQQFVYSTQAIRSYPGNSGGPVFVENEDGELYPAGVYLGGTGQSLVRAIDQQVAELIRRAGVSANGGGNGTGGGLTYVSANVTESGNQKGFLSVKLRTPGARWRLDSVPSFQASSTVPVLLDASRCTIVFESVPGFQTPTPRDLRIVPYQMAVLDIDYAPLASTLSMWRSTYGLTGPSALDTDYDGVSDLLEFAFGGNPVVSSDLPDLADPRDPGIRPKAGGIWTDLPGPHAIYYPTIAFRRRSGAKNGIVYTVLETRDLRVWTPVGFFSSSSGRFDYDPYIVDSEDKGLGIEVVKVRGNIPLNGPDSSSGAFMQVLVKEQ